MISDAVSANYRIREKIDFRERDRANRVPVERLAAQRETRHFGIPGFDTPLGFRIGLIGERLVTCEDLGGDEEAVDNVRLGQET